MAIILPDTIKRDAGHIPWMQDLQDDGVAIIPYKFTQGKSPEYYHAQMEGVVRDYFLELDYNL